MPDKINISWNEIRSSIDKPMLLVTILLFFLGILAIHSAGAGSNVSLLSSFAMRQFMWGLLSAVFYIAVLKTGYRRFIEAAVPLFVIMLALLLVLLVVGHTSKGAQSWFNLGFIRFQPSEVGKIVFAVTLAWVCSKFPPITMKGMLPAILASGVMILLILLQPDLGSCLVYSVMLFAVLIVGGAPVKILLGAVISALALLPVGWMILKPYQRMRLLVFIDPSVDPQGAGYNVIQSRIAVGSGGFFGKGLMQGTQAKLHFLPEPHTDFIFSVFSEETGFIGSFIVILLFALLLWRLLSVALYTKDTEAKYMVTAIAAWLWFQVTESVAMSMGLAPVTGLPLPLFSYGGSSLLAVAMGLALVQSVVVTSKKDRF